MNAQLTLEKLQAAYEQIDEVCDILNSAVNMSPECKLYDAIWKMADIAEKSIAENIGVSYESLNWFIHENDFGKKAFAASSKLKPDFIIDSVATFLEFEMSL